MTEPAWHVVELPLDVADDQIPRSKHYIAEQGLIIAEVIYGSEYAYEIVKRLNEWEHSEAERHRALLAEAQHHTPT